MCACLLSDGCMAVRLWCRGSLSEIQREDVCAVAAVVCACECACARVHVRLLCAFVCDVFVWCVGFV